MALLPRLPGSHNNANGLNWLWRHLRRWRHSVTRLARALLRFTPTVSSPWRHGACAAWHASLTPPQDPRRSFVFEAASTLSGFRAGAVVASLSGHFVPSGFSLPSWRSRPPCPALGTSARHAPQLGKWPMAFRPPASRRGPPRRPPQCAPRTRQAQRMCCRRPIGSRIPDAVVSV